MILRSGMFSAGVVAAVLLAGCATRAERPTAEMSRASTLIDQAERAGAQRYAAAELQEARLKLNQADEAADNGKGELAQRLAMQAAVDAELAIARTGSGEAQQAAEELHRSTQTLQEEADRSSTENAPPTEGTPR